jgi:hypothetical protein
MFGVIRYLFRLAEILAHPWDSYSIIRIHTQIFVVTVVRSTCKSIVSQEPTDTLER